MDTPDNTVVLDIALSKLTKREKAHFYSEAGRGCLQAIINKIEEERESYKWYDVVRRWKASQIISTGYCFMRILQDIKDKNE